MNMRLWICRHLEALLAMVFVLLLFVLAQVRHAPLFEPLRQSGLTRRTLTGICVLAVLLLLGRLLGWQMAELRSLLRFVPLVVALMAYESLKHMHASALTLWLGIRPKDGLMLSIDKALFGQTPSLWLDQWGLTGKGFIAVMAGCYSLYYLAPVSVLAWFLLRGEIAQFRLVRRAVLLALYGGYVCYILVPVAGPMSGDLALPPLFFEKMTNYQELMSEFRYAYDCFPSLHTAVPWLLVMVCWKQIPGWLMAVGIVASAGVTLSTIALRYHYGVDLMAGLLWAWGCSWLARCSLGWEARAVGAGAAGPEPDTTSEDEDFPQGAETEPQERGPVPV